MGVVGGGGKGWCTFSDTQQKLSEYLLTSFIYSINCDLKNLDELRTSLSNSLFKQWFIWVVNGI